jgi:hypothetical protein
MNTPRFLRFLNKQWRLSRAVVAYYDALPSGTCNEEQVEVVAYLRNHPAWIFPYSFCEHYRPQDVPVFYDTACALPYTLQDGHRIYLKKSWKGSKIRRKYNALRLEQDPTSPHRYLTDQFRVEAGDVLVDIGAAEGNFALSVVDKVKRIYLIEADGEWIEALRATFAPWRDKVTILHKFVSDHDDQDCITLDTLMEDDPEINFVKIDVDGAERELLAGATNTLREAHPMRLALCTYHRQGDDQEFMELLNGHGFKTEFSRGYMLFYYNRQKLSPPYLRRALIRAVKD